MFIHELLVSQHGIGLYSRAFAEARQAVHVWRQRHAGRRELAHWSANELHDIGRSQGDAEVETRKHFWQA